ncbi:lamin tail domain-containing protein [Lysobacter sp. 5GHs7-4]|uniref:lamin tail domain-containing protein n=1 Tax=Lysobacter sp. 5GHs7-4 TaxID=2904253 RepID=UPI001E51C60D|nr:lamin tail domain-containing protein [Lysobacter sp. 5GHs7-4]UHQ22753.1 lamin tail domain-containing protein [Lysobacter sp. 5GHs7-4]
MDKFLGRCAAVALAFLISGGAHAQVVISQVYGGGGNSGATLKSDFIELRNNGTSPVDLSGWSVQYASSAGTSWARTALTGTIPAGGYYLIKQADGAGGTVDLPTPDATGTLAMAGTAGKVALVNNNVSLSGACPVGGATVIDFVGYGTAANCSETAPTATLTNSTAALRKNDGATDTGNNSADFSTGAPTPRNTGTAPPNPPDPPVALTIAQIQGDGLLSAYDDKLVVTEGIVTARKFNNGFFLQAANDDGNPATSEAVFVFTGAAPPASAAVGNRVRVTAKVDEFTPPSNPNQLSITELVSPTVELLETGVALPAAVELTAAELGANATPGTLERLEAMRVSVAQSVAVSGSDGSIDEDDANSSSDGVFYVRLPEVAVPFREPGIGIMDTIPIPAGKNPPRFDTNQERLMVRSRGQIGALPLSVDGQAAISGLLGVLDYFAGTWALLPDTATPPTFAGGKQPEAVADAAYEDITIGGFNLLRFFDEVPESNGAPTLKPEAVEKRLGKTSAAICQYLKTPDILGVVEVENVSILGRLADRINSTCASAPGYVPYLVSGNDPGGINVGFLVATRDSGAGQPRVEVVEVVQYGKDATFANPNGSTALLNDRPPLLLRAIVHQDNGASYPITVIANHLRSLNGIDDVAAGGNGWSTEGARVRAKRGAQAAYLAGLIEQMQQTNPNEKIVLVGDFNAFEFNDGYTDVLGIIKGEEAAEDQVLTYVDSPLTSIFVDGSQLIADPAQRYSYVFEGNAQTLDHVLVNEALVMDNVGLSVDHARINADFGVFRFGDASQPLRVSDHDPVRLVLSVPGFRSADLAVSAAASTASARAGQTVTYTAGVFNAGPNAADSAAVAFVFDALVAPVATAPAGWTCAAPVQDATTTTVTCTTASLASQGSATFSLNVVLPALASGSPLRMAVAAQSQTRDPANGDNQASAQVVVTTLADLSVQIAGGALPVRKGAIATFLVPVTNAGPDAAAQPKLVLTGNVAVSAAAVAAPSGWTCARTSVPTGFRAECSRNGNLNRGTQWFALAVVVPERPAVGSNLVFDANISAQTPDPVAGNNSDTISVQIRR